jgi:PadR family transcriptional regulator PadR
MSLDVWTEQLRRGALEFSVLLAVAPGSRYGLEILRHLKTFSGLVITEGTIYPLLARLTRDAVLHAEWSATEAAHPRKYYRLTPLGRRRLDEMCDHWQDFSAKIERLIQAAGASR